MLKTIFFTSVGLVAMCSIILSFTTRCITCGVYTLGDDGRCTKFLQAVTTVENPPNPTITLPSATTEQGGECHELEVWFTL